MKLDEIGHHDEQSAARQRGVENGLGDVLRRLMRIFRQCRDRVETEEGINQYCSACECCWDIPRNEWFNRIALGSRRHEGKANDRRANGELYADEQRSHADRQLQAKYVQSGYGGGECDDPHPVRHRREHRSKINARQENVDERQHQIVSQRGPANEKANLWANGFLGEGIGRPRGGVDLHHLDVAPGSEQNRQRGDYISARHGSLGDLGDDSERVEHRHWRHVSKTDHHKGNEGELSLKLDR